VSRLARFIATGAYTGYAPLVPGTFGTIPGVLLAPLFARLGQANPALYVLALLAAIAVAIWAASAVAAEEGVSDPQIVVVDEVVGYLVTMAFVPVTPGTLFAAFVAFRLFDIVKPPPIRHVDRKVKGGLGVMSDDIVAAFYTLLVLAAVKRILD